MPKSRTWPWLAVIVLLTVQVVQIVIVLHRESLTWDEGAHMYAGYRMWKNGDYGLNPEHPPLVKLLATLPVLGDNLWVPPLKGIFFKGEAYLGGRDWLEHNDGGSQRLVFRMRLAAATLAIALSLVIFFAAREWFGTTAALVALTLAVFDPNILAHSGLVTTDIGAALFFLAAIYAFYRYVKRPTLPRLLMAGVVAGLLLAAKHSGILIVPTLVLLIGWEIAFATKGERARVALRLSGAFAAIIAIGVLVLWSYYGFRYAARPAGLQLIPSLSDYSQSLTPFQKGSIWWMAHLHLLPESYLFGMVDIRVFGKGFSTYILGNWYPHGVLWYFPAVLTMKTTLGLLALLGLAVFAIVTGRLGRGQDQNRDHTRAPIYVLVPGALYLLVAMINGLNIGVRHILPLYPLAAILAGAGAAALAVTVPSLDVGLRSTDCRAYRFGAERLPKFARLCQRSLGRGLEHPQNSQRLQRRLGQTTLSGERVGGPASGEDCWFAYTVRPLIRPEIYGIHCHVLPNGFGAVLGEGGLEPVPAVIRGTVLLSAAEVEGSLWPSWQMNPYRGFQTLKPDDEIDYGVLVYRGDVHMEEAGGLSRAFLASEKLQSHQSQEALALAEEAVKLSPGNLFTEWSLGDAAAALGKKEEARAAYQSAIIAAKGLDPQRQAEYTKALEDSIKKL